MDQAKQELLEQLLEEKRKAEIMEKDVEIERTGKKIVLPKGMSFDEGITWLKRKKKEDEVEIRVDDVIEGYPLDAAYSFVKAMAKKYGWNNMVPKPGFFGSQNPPLMISIETGPGVDDSVQVPWGRFQIPNMQGYLESSIVVRDQKPFFCLDGVVRNKHKEECRELASEARKVLSVDSIYKGKAIRIKFPPDPEEFNVRDCPKYIDTRGINTDELIFSADLQGDVEAHLFAPVMYSDRCRKSGTPLKRGVLLEGPYGCLAADTMISINRAGKGFEIRIEDLVRRLNGEDKRYRWDPEIPTMVQREESDGTIRLGKIEKAWCSGVKDTFLLSTSSGRAIRATDEHPFLTERGWLRLDQVKVGDQVHVRGSQKSEDGNQRERGERAPYKARSVGPHHPYGKGNTQSGYHVAEHRLVMEAVENDLSLDDYITRLKLGDVAGLVFLDPEALAVHHKDGNTLNNELSNLEKISHPGHGKLHGDEAAKNVLFKAGLETVVSIEPYGTEVTYDIAVEGEPHNFVANGFVVHNTGKTMAAYVMAKICENFGWTFIYLENTGDINQAVFFAQQYQPAVIFAEDIDSVMGEKRTNYVNQVLNTIDGVASKNSEIMVVFTTNHIDKVNSALLRPGRLDAVISVTPPDAKAAEALLRLYGRNLINPKEDLSGPANMLSGKIPAIIREVVERSKLISIVANKGKDFVIGANELTQSASMMLNQIKLIEPRPDDTRSDVEKAAGVLADGLGTTVGKVLDAVQRHNGDNAKPAYIPSKTETKVVPQLDR